MQSTKFAPLQKHKLDDGAPYFTPKGARYDVKKVEREVEEYFDQGIALKKGDIVFDVGANVGLFALHAAQRFGGELSLYCFEPIPDIFSALSANFEEHPILAKTKHRLFNCGLTSSDERKTIPFYYFKNNPCDSTYDIEAKRRDFEDAFHTFGERWRGRIQRVVPGAAGRAIGRAAGRVIGNLPKGPVGRWGSDRFTGMEVIPCPLRTLGSVIDEVKVPRIDLLKVDVEGAELDVLLGMKDEHWKKIRQIVLEGHDKDGRLRELIALIEKHGMKVGPVGKPADTEQLGLANFVLTASRPEQATNEVSR